MANGVNDPVGGLSAATTAAQPAASWGTGGLGSYQLSDPSLAATPEWLKNRDPSLNRVDWGGNYDPVTGQLGVLPFFVGGSEAQDASYFQGGDTSNMAGYAGVLETGLPTYNISTEFGRPVDNYLKLNPASENPVRIINASQGKVTYEGAGDPQGLVSALDQATAEGNKNIWSVQAKVGDQWVTTHKNEPIGNLVRDVMLPAMLAVAGGAGLGPLLGGTQGTLLGAGKLAAAAGTGLGSAAGSFTGNIAAGKSLEDALKAAAITGVTAGVLKGVLPGGGPSGVSPGEAAAAKFGYPGGLLNNAGVLYDAAGNVVATGVGTPAAVLASNVASTGASGALQTVTGSLGSAVAPAVVGAGTGAILGAGTSSPLTTVTGTSPNANIGAALPAVAGTTPSLGTGTVGQQAVVTGQTSKPAEIGGALPAVVGTTPVMGTGTVGQQVTVSNKTDKPGDIGGALPAVVGTTPVMGTGTVGQQVTVSNKTDKDVGIGGSLPSVAGTTPVLGTGTVGQQVTVSNKTDKPGDIGASLAVIPTAALPAATPTGGNLDYLNDVLQNEIDTQTVSGKRPITDKIITGVLGAAGLGAVANTIGASGKPATTGDKIMTGLTGAAILAGALGGGGGGGTGGTGTGLDSLAPIFRAQLPAPRGQFAPSALTQRDRSDIDYARYGYGPARSFFNYVPETAAERAAFAAAAAPAPRVGVGSVFSTGAAPVGATTSVLSSSLDILRAAMPGASDAEIEAFLNTPEGRQALTMIFEDMGAQPRAKGGKMGGRESFAVDGVGTGRSDEIPALLSDGEYVIDAETVAMLGDGSSRAGAKRLDDFRVKVRKHKGRNLAKGKFSANAKRPERYLSGGLV
jgi:hypothetical protein